jgi:hypothetical protein
LLCPSRPDGGGAGDPDDAGEPDGDAELEHDDVRSARQATPAMARPLAMQPGMRASPPPST